MSTISEKSLSSAPYKRSVVHMEDTYLLTRQQKRVLRLLSEGNSNKVIAARLKISEATVKAHMSEIFRTLKCQNRTQAALLGLCLRLGLPVDIIIGDSELANEVSLSEN